MDKSHLRVVIWLVVSSTTTVLAADSTLLWALRNNTATCIASIFDDPVDWVPEYGKDPEFTITPQLYCLEDNAFQLGPLAPNPSVPDMIITANLDDNQLISYDITPEGLAESYFDGAVGVTGIAIDYQSQNIYFTVPTRIVIIQFGRSHPYFNVLVEDLHNASQIVVDPDAGFIFWAESEGIMRASLIGDRQKLLVSKQSKDWLLSIDTVGQHIFALEGNELAILIYNGKTQMSYSVPETLVGITYDQEYIFGTTASYPNILIMKAATGEVMVNVSFKSDFTQGDITTRLAESKQPKSPCATDNGRCSHICIHVSMNERKCTCGLGFVLQEDGSSCKPKYLTDNFVLATDAGTNAIYQIDTTSGQISGIPIERVINQLTGSVAYDPVSQQVIWMDTGNGTLRSLVLTENSTERILYTFDNESFISDIAYDHINEVVYCADYDLSEISRVYMSGGHDVLLSTVSQGKPVQIALDIIGRYVYWSSKGEPSQILRARIPDGSGITPIIESGLVNPSGLALNLADSLLYWVDTRDLVRANVNGNGKLRLTGVQDGSTLALDNNYLYISNTHDVSRLALSDRTKTAFSMDIFSLLDGISLYSSSVLLQPTTMMSTTEATTTAASAMTTTTMQVIDGRSGASGVTGLTWPIWGIIWLHHIIG